LQLLALVQVFEPAAQLRNVCPLKGQKAAESANGAPPAKRGFGGFCPAPATAFPLFLLCRLFAESSELVHTIHGPCPRYEGGNKPRRPRGLWAASAGVAALVAAWPAVHKAVNGVGERRPTMHYSAKKIAACAAATPYPMC
jgi:hypothetical protein